MKSVARRRRAYTNHAEAAEWCRAHPGQWWPLGQYSVTGVSFTRRVVERAVAPRYPRNHSVWVPAGAFETRTSLTEFLTLVEVRFNPDHAEQQQEGESIEAGT